METLLHYENAYKEEGLAIALGNFDGVHLGHRRLFEKVIAEGARLGIKTMVYTFEKHPKHLLSPEKPFHQIMDNFQKMRIIEEQHLDYLYLDDFLKVKELSAADFAEKILKDKFNAKSIIIGWNYRFGYKGEGTPELLMELGLKLGFDVNIVPAVQLEGHTISSTLIRHYIRSGDMEDAALYLGQNYLLRSRVIHGKRNGGKMGIHTANLEIDKFMTLPQRGVYATNTIHLGNKYKSVTNVGMNPTFDGEETTVETHIFDFHGDLYGEFIEVEFLKKMRNEIKFPNIQALIDQITLDIEERNRI